jgi:HEAT repeat protein
VSTRVSPVFATAGVLFAWFFIFQSCLLAGSEAYDLHHVNGIEGFTGSAAAGKLLRKNGFVVADPSFKQIFEPYIKSPQTERPSETNRTGSSLPAFITTDSAWHTYHVLLEEGVKQMEEIQSQRLLKFSRELLSAATERKAGPELALFASVGLALQDAHYRQSLTAEDRRIVEGLRAGTTPVAVPIGFNLSPLQFRAQSFYAQSPELSDYFAARQWYADVVFRLVNARETKSAINVATMVNGNPQLLDLWRQLSDPYDAFLAPAEDGTVREYATALATVLGTNFQTGSISDSQTALVQKLLESKLALPRISDQLLSPEQYAEFGKQSRGFRLLPPRRLPCAVCFQNTVDPRIPNRMYPSGLDFLAASAVLRSSAAVRAVESQFGHGVSEAILKTDCGPLPQSLHGEAMQLLAKLEEPLPAKAPAALRSDAWADLQLWTQLGAWAEQRHTWALHSKPNVNFAGIITPPVGMVAPYPEFFGGLATLTRRTAKAFEQAGLAQKFEVKMAASELRMLLNLSQKMSGIPYGKELEKNSGKLEQLSRFQNRYYDKHRAELEKNGAREAYKQMQKDLEALAGRCSASGQANEAETETLRAFFECRQDTERLINDFAPVCDRLAELARKSLTGVALNEDDAKWIENYGVTLAGFHFYQGNSYEVPRDDFPIVTRVFSSPLTSSVLHAGLARPQALYVIIPNGKSLQLYRGAVMTYREFVRSNEQLLDDESWRDLIAKGQTPPAPPFTRSFYAETSVSELFKQLRALRSDEDASLADSDEILWQIGSRATERDLPELIEVFTHTKDGSYDILDAVGEIIARLPWESHQKQFIDLLASPENMRANAVARIFIEHPTALETGIMVSAFAHHPPRARRLDCVILSRLPTQTDATRKLLLQALQDPAEGVRWQAALAIGKAGWNDAQSDSALVATLNDTNELVGAAAAYSLARLRATNEAPALFAKLTTELQSTNHSQPEDLDRQGLAIRKDIRGEENHAVPVLDPERLQMRIYVGGQVFANARRRAGMRIPPQPFTLPIHHYDMTTALIEALGDLGYGGAEDELFKLRSTDYEVEATIALSKFAIDRLTKELLATAKDKQADSYVREKALVTLGNIAAANRAHDLVPLLDDTTPIVYSRPMPGPEWRICDRAAETVSMLVGWQERRRQMFTRPEQREQTLTRAREWAKTVQ